jgi:hypothetical protein
LLKSRSVDLHNVIGSGCPGRLLLIGFFIMRLKFMEFIISHHPSRFGEGFISVLTVFSVRTMT